MPQTQLKPRGAAPASCCRARHHRSKPRGHRPATLPATLPIPCGSMSRVQRPRKRNPPPHRAAHPTPTRIPPPPPPPRTRVPGQAICVLSRESRQCTSECSRMRAHRGRQAVRCVVGLVVPGDHAHSRHERQPESQLWLCLGPLPPVPNAFDAYARGARDTTGPWRVHSHNTQMLPIPHQRQVPSDCKTQRCSTPHSSPEGTPLPLEPPPSCVRWPPQTLTSQRTMAPLPKSHNIRRPPTPGGSDQMTPPRVESCAMAVRGHALAAHTPPAPSGPVGTMREYCKRRKFFLRHLRRHEFLGDHAPPPPPPPHQTMA